MYLYFPDRPRVSLRDQSESCEGTAIPVLACIGPEGSRELRHPDFKTIGTNRSGNYSYTVWSLRINYHLVSAILCQRYSSDCSSEHMNFVSPHNAFFLLLEWITWLLVPINHHRGRGLTKARREITRSRVKRPLPWRRKIQPPCIRHLDCQRAFWKPPHIIFIMLYNIPRLIKLRWDWLDM